MRPLWVGLALVFLLLCQGVAQERMRLRFRQPPAGGSANPIAAARLPLGDTALPNTGWSTAGATITTGRSQCGSTVTAYTGTAGTINTAISNCASGGGGAVVLGAGTFSLSSSIAMKSNVTLRGQGMSTIISFTNMGGVTYFWGSGEAGIIFQGGYSTPNEIAPGLASCIGSTIKDWTGTNGVSSTYTQGATVLNLGASATGLSAGDTLVLYETDDADASVPNSGYFVSSKTGASNAIAWEGSGETQGTGQQQRVRVASVSGSQVTITKGLLLPTGTWRASLNPKACWFVVADTIHDAGVESLLVQSTGYTSEHLAVIAINWAVDCWVKGVGIKPRNTTWHASDAVDYGVYVTDSRNITIRDSWVDRMIGGGIFTTTSYGIALKTTFDSLVENNILNEVESPLMILTASSGNVFAYNYERFVNDNMQEGGFQQHQVGSSMNLVEGNDVIKQWSDFFHGSTVLSTYARNYIHGQTDIASYHRWYNFVGNISGAATIYKALATDSMKYDRFDGGVGFRLGYPQQNNDSSTTNGVALDSVVWTSALFWGNYTTAGGTKFLSADVPSTDPTFPNPVPSSQTLPASFFRSSRPGYFTVSGVGTVAWPPIGPDVSGGTTTGVAGHANKLPAQLVYDAVGGAIASFDPTLYGP